MVSFIGRPIGTPEFSNFECIIYLRARGFQMDNPIADRKSIEEYVKNNLEESLVTMEEMYPLFKHVGRKRPFDGAFFRILVVLQANAYNESQPHSKPYVV